MMVCRRLSDGLILEVGDQVGSLASAESLTVNAATESAIRSVIGSGANATLTNVTTDNNGISTGLITSVALTPVAADPAYPDFATNYQLAFNRLTDIVNNAGTYTAAQLQSAVADEARILRRILRLLSLQVQ